MDHPNADISLLLNGGEQCDPEYGRASDGGKTEGEYIVFPYAHKSSLYPSKDTEIFP
jgi:hypothetical protein